MTPEEQLKLYENDVNAEANIRDAITKAYQDLRPESELVHTYENEQFPSFYGEMSGYGTSAADLSPTRLLQNAWGNAGRKSTSAQVARDVFDVRRAGMEDLIKSGLNQWNQGYTGAQNAWQRWWAQKQHEDQMRLANRQLQNTGIKMPTITDEQRAEAYRLYIADMNAKNAVYNKGADEAYAKYAKQRMSGYTGAITPSVKPTAANTKSTYLNSIINKLRGL